MMLIGHHLQMTDIVSMGAASVSIELVLLSLGSQESSRQWLSNHVKLSYCLGSSSPGGLTKNELTKCTVCLYFSNIIMFM